MLAQAMEPAAGYVSLVIKDCLLSRLQKEIMFSYKLMMASHEVA